MHGRVLSLVFVELISGECHGTVVPIKALHGACACAPSRCAFLHHKSKHLLVLSINKLDVRKKPDTIWGKHHRGTERLHLIHKWLCQTRGDPLLARSLVQMSRRCS